ncbi:MAG: hypothetical protein RR633_09100 [Acinetobacter sp.]
MVASTNIKFYVHTNTNAPQLQNAFGCMINVLDACLVNGFGSQSISTLTASGNTVTATFSSAHNFMQYQVIEIAGATQTEYNGEHRILTVPNANSITFQLAAAPSVNTATGTISCSLPALGWLKPFSGTGKAAYRSSNTLLASRPYLRVVDVLDPAYTETYAKFAKVGIVEDMTDIDTMLGVQAPYDSANPDKNWVGTGSGTGAVNGWARWYYASATESTNSSYNIDYQAPTNGNVTWVLVGTEDYFYVIPEIRVGYSAGLIYGFGAIDSLIPVDNANTFLSSTLNANSASNNAHKIRNTALSNDLFSSCLLQRNYKNETNYNTCFSKSFLSGNLTGNSNILTNDSYAGVTAFDVFALEGSVLRGKFKGIKWLYSNLPYSNLALIVFNNQIYLSKNVAAQSNNLGQILLNVGEL